MLFLNILQHRVIVRYSGSTYPMRIEIVNDIISYIVFISLHTLFNLKLNNIYNDN